MRSFASSDAVGLMAGLLLLLPACRGGSVSPEPREETFARPPTLAEVLADPHPTELYARHLSAFEFESKITAPPTEGRDTELSARTTYRRNERGHFEFTRHPLTGDGDVIVRSVGGRTFLKSPVTGGFSRVRQQREFDRWADAAFLEIFAIFREAGFADASQGTLENGLLCWTRGTLKLCADSDTGLPVSGSATTALKNGAKVRAEFRVTPKAAGTILVDIPA
jgi:hypothetical protein